LRAVLVVVEVALSVVLLTGASVSMRSFAALLQTNPGFQPERTLMVGIPLPSRIYKTIEQRNNVATNLLERILKLPGVEAATIGFGAALARANTAYSINGVAAGPSRAIKIGTVSSQFTTAMGIPLKRGRNLTVDEVARGAHVALINETAGRLWPAGEDPLGRQITLDILTNANGAALPQSPSGTVTVIGVVGDTRNTGLRDSTAAGIFVPYTLVAPPGRELIIRTRNEPLAMIHSIREAARQIDERMPLGAPVTLTEMLGHQTVQPRFTMALLAFFAGLGMALAAAGIYSVIACDVVQKTHEIGVRVALGASRINIIGMVLGKSAKMIVAGLAIGLLGGEVLERVVRFQFFRAAKLDWITAGATIAALACTGIVSSWLPARRASKLHPAEALRYEA
jgi:putative ABC transport system permease protein